MHGHNVVIACLLTGVYGITPATVVAKDMLRTFKSLRFGLMFSFNFTAYAKFSRCQYSKI